MDEAHQNSGDIRNKDSINQAYVNPEQSTIKQQNLHEILFPSSSSWVSSQVPFLNLLYLHSYMLNPITTFIFPSKYC